jgi:hypothetical protein
VRRRRSATPGRSRSIGVLLGGPAKTDARGMPPDDSAELASPVAGRAQSNPESPLGLLEGPCQPDGFRAVAIKYSGCFSQLGFLNIFYCKSSGSSFGSAKPPFRHRGAGAGGSPLLSSVNQPHNDANDCNHCVTAFVRLVRSMSPSMPLASDGSQSSQWLPGCSP